MSCWPVWAIGFMWATIVLSIVVVAVLFSHNRQLVQELEWLRSGMFMGTDNFQRFVNTRAENKARDPKRSESLGRLHQIGYQLVQCNGDLSYEQCLEQQEWGNELVEIAKYLDAQ